MNSAQIKEQMVTDYVKNIDFISQNFSIKQIKEDLKTILMEIPAVEVEYNKENIIVFYSKNCFYIICMLDLGSEAARTLHTQFKKIKNKNKIKNKFISDLGAEAARTLQVRLFVRELLTVFAHTMKKNKLPI